jgi:hypothetical protein
MILLVSSAAACAPSAPPAAPAPRSAWTDADVPPILALLSDRDRLSLTSSQVTALDSIAREWDAANTKLLRRNSFVRARRAELGFVAVRADASPSRAAHNRRAAEAVERALTPSQRKAACEPPRRSRAGAPSRAAARGPKRPAWPWCATEVTAQPLAAVQAGG